MYVLPELQVGLMYVLPALMCVLPILMYVLPALHVLPALLQDGLIEWNTFFLIARRQLPRFYRPFNTLYWATFYPMRLILFPLLLPLFYREMQARRPAAQLAAGVQALVHAGGRAGMCRHDCMCA